MNGYCQRFLWLCSEEDMFSIPCDAGSEWSGMFLPWAKPIPGYEVVWERCVRDKLCGSIFLSNWAAGQTPNGTWALWGGCSFGHWGCASAAPWALTPLSSVVPVPKPGSDSANSWELGFLFRAMAEVFCRSITWPRAENWWLGFAG